MSWGIRRESAKHAAERQRRIVLCREVWSRDSGLCVARDLLVPSVRCSGPLDVHEVIPRSAWRGGYLVAENCVLVCRAHHDWIGEHPDDAHAVGLHGYSYERPADG